MTSTPLGGRAGLGRSRFGLRIRLRLGITLGSQRGPVRGARLSRGELGAPGRVGVGGLVVSVSVEVEPEFVPDVLCGLVELAKGFPNALAHLWELLGTEDDQGEHKDEKHLLRADTEHLTSRGGTSLGTLTADSSTEAPGTALGQLLH